MIAMDKISDLFVKRHFSQCLMELELFSSSTVFEDFYIQENNKLVCQTLVSLAKKEDISVTFDSFLMLYDNYCIALNHSNPLLPPDTQIQMLLNVHWYALSTLDKSSNKDYVWDLLLSRVSDICIRVSCNISSLEFNNSDFVTNLFSKLLSAYESNLKTSHLILELVVSTILIVMISQCDCDEKIYNFASQILKNKCDIKALVSTGNKTKNPLPVFNFGYFKTPDTIINDTDCLFSWVELFKYIKSLNILNLKTGDHYCLSREYCLSLRYYCIALKCYQQEKYSVALGNLLEGLAMQCPVELLYQYRCLLGQVYSTMKERYKAVENFSAATKLFPNLSNAHYYLGCEYGLMGLHDKMLCSYQNLIMSYKRNQEKKWSEYPLIDRTLNVLHGPTISKGAAIYVLAIAYGINEMFDDAAVAFNKLLNLRNFSSIVTNQNGALTLPHIITIYHESTAICLLTGDLTQAEDLCRVSLNMYPGRSLTENVRHCNTNLHGTKDIEWIRGILEHEIELNIENTSQQNPYYEDYLSFFEEDVIGLLLLADLHRIQDRNEGRITLNQALLLLSKYIARSQKDTEQSDRIILVKALTAKTCLQIAKMQTTSKSFEDVDKMFKRALSCNNGDKDVLFHYASFLSSADRVSDAEKLWNTFYEKESIIQIDKTQSLALKYLLRTQISQRQIENLSLKFL